MSRHIIQRQVVELRSPQSLPARQIETEVEFLLAHEVWPQIDAICSRLDVAGMSIQIGRMELDLAAMPSTGLRSQWSGEVCRLFDASLRKRLDLLGLPQDPNGVREAVDLHGEGTTDDAVCADADRALPICGSRLDAFVFFLRHGLLPWWWDRGETDLRGLMTDLIAEERPALRRVLLKHLASSGTAVRLSSQFGIETVRAILDLLIANPSVAAMVAALHERAVRGFPSPVGTRGKLPMFVAVEARLLALACHLANRTHITGSELIEEFRRHGPNSEPMLTQFLSDAMAEIGGRLCAAESAAQIAAAEHGMATAMRTDAKTAPSLTGERPADPPAHNKPASSSPSDADLATGATGPPPVESASSATTQSSIPDPRQADSIENNETPSVPPADADLTTEMAGLVLLWPFLEKFFTHLELVENGDFRTPSARFRALHLLHFLATGEGEAPEHALALPKILCAIPLPEPVPFSVGLTEMEKAEATGLLGAVIRNWPPLKNTSIGGFRQAFLQREGRLALPEDATPMPGWKLRVERKGLDILLDQLPWGFLVIKLPWMPQPLYVEW